MGRFGRRWTWLGLFTALLTLIGAAPASAAYKPFSLTIATGSPTYDSGTFVTAGGQRMSVTGSGQAVTITATFTNETTTQQLGSADLGLPASLAATSASLSDPGTATVTSCTGEVTGPCVQLRDLSIAPGGSVTATISVDTAACAQGAATWSVEAKQANNFSGSPGNDLNLDTSNPSTNLVTTLDGACSLAFQTEPHNALTTTPLTPNEYLSGVDWNPLGGAVTVQVRDAGDNVVTGSTAPAEIALGANPGDATLGGNISQAASGTSGTASFGNLTVNRPASGYTLLASSGTLTTATSSSFVIQDQVATCPANGSCKTDTGTSANGNHAAIAATAVSSGGLLLESVNADGGTQLVCQGYTSADTNTYESTTTFDASKVITTTIVTPAIPLTGNPNQILKAQQICFGAPYEFTTASGTPAPAGTLPDGTRGFIGLLQTCTGSTVGPCHNRQQDTTIADPSSPLGFDIVLVADVPAGLPGDPWHT